MNKKMGIISIIAILFCITNAYSADTYYEIWRSESVNPATAIRLQDWWESTSYDDYTGTPEQHYYYWIRVVTAEEKSSSKMQLGSFVTMYQRIDCPTAARRGKESPIRVRVAMTNIGIQAYGDLTCRIGEADPWPNPDDTMDEWTVVANVSGGGDPDEIMWDQTWKKDIIISDYEPVTDTAEVYLWCRYLHESGIDTYDLQNQTVNINVTLRDYSDDAPSNISASQGTYPDRVHITWSPASGNSLLTAAATGWTGTPTGSLNVTIEPLEARSAGAQWRVDGGSWRNSGYTQSGLSVGQHTVEFKSISGWNTPANQNVQINAGLTTYTTGTYTAQTGSLNVTIEPEGARNAGAQWRVDGGSWHNSGYTQSGLPVGQHTVEFKSVSGWNTPANKNVQINATETTYTTGTYIRQTGSLTVTIYPVEVQPPARWRLTSGPDTTWKQSDDTITNIPIGDYTLQFNEVSGWKKPDDRVITISEENNSESGTYYEYVYFPDANLKAAVEEELGISNPTTQDMLSLTILWASDLGIVDPNGIQYAINLTDLHIGSNNISDISALSGMTNLTQLSIHSNNISDISALSGLANLRYLYLGSNNISDIYALSGMTNLRNLTLYNNNISDISVLSGMNNLILLQIDDNNISDISALSEMIGMTRLFLSSNNVSDISALSIMTSMTELYLSQNNISDISALSGMTNLTYLWLGYNNISNISALSEMIGMTNLFLHSSNVSDISALSGMTNLTYLNVFNNPLDNAAYCVYLPLIEDNNPGIDLRYDSNPNPLVGDCDGDCYVDFFDFALLANYWKDIDCGDCGGVDLNNDSNVDSNDLKIIADNWLKQIKFYENVLDDDLNWTTEGEWEFGQPTGGGGITYGNPDPNSGYTDANVYGVNLNGDYSTSVGGPYYLTAGPFDCTYFCNVRLRFARWLNTDDPTHVESTIEVSNDGALWIEVWEHTAGSAITDNDWQLVEYDISSIADWQDTVYVRWGYEIFEGAYPYSGWNIDDIELWGNPRQNQQDKTIGVDLSIKTTGFKFGAVLV